ncbi:hypothetical protein H2C83_15115 [Thermoactinomyces sp. AMNI-1]|uniref:Uncharacterized protein n=2 Tax=Thermoactinomyces mirandus TaxID=2756294 RepID=A0A7W1XUQ1_9BACL|nr:hypothetical protein [Thermoactinomyces mirandus]
MKLMPVSAKCLLSILLIFSFAVTTGFVLPPSDSVKKNASMKSENCPKPGKLVYPGKNAENEIQAALPELIREAYGEDPRYKEWEVKRIISLKDPKSSPYSNIAIHQCGKRTANRSFLVELFFPQFLPSASLSQGQIFVAKTKDGWTVWFRYH